MREAKIIYFDYWTFGIHNFMLFNQFLRKKGFSTKLIHIGSWRGIQGPVHEVIDGIDCYDIRYYNTNFIHNVLEQERPVAVVMLNSTFITDRSLILSCKKLNIKSIYLAHGALIREEFIDKSIKVFNESFKGTRLQRAIKNLRGTVLNFLVSTARFNKKILLTLHPYSVLLNTLINPGTYLFFPPPSFDLEPDLVLVYGKDDADFYLNRLQIDPCKVMIVGNPELDSFFQNSDVISQDKDIFLKENSIPSNMPYVVYIEEGTVEENLWNNETRINFINKIDNICRDTGFHLVVKLHPRTANGIHFKSILAIDGITVLSKVDFPKLIFFCDKCISHYSTTLIYPMLLDKPILVPRWGDSALLITINTEKEVTFVYSEFDFKTLIRQQKFNYNRDIYLDNFIPYRDGRTGARIAELILNLVA